MTLDRAAIDAKALSHEAKHRRSERRLMIVLTVGMILGTLAVGSALGAWVASRKWDPLGDYPVQQVSNSLKGFPSPAVASTDDVTVTATKCNVTTKPVRIVVSVTTWVLVEPPGTLIEIPSAGTAQRLPGCTRTTYSNPIPRQVLARVKQLADRGILTSVWHISGKETPVDDDNAEGVPRVWETGNFTIVYEP